MVAFIYEMVCLYNLQDLKSGWKVTPSSILVGLLNRKYWDIQLLAVLCLIVDGIPHWKAWQLVYLWSHGPLGLSNDLMHGEYLIRTELVEFMYWIIKFISSNLQLLGNFYITQFSGHRSHISSLLISSSELCRCRAFDTLNIFIKCLEKWPVITSIELIYRSSF